MSDPKKIVKAVIGIITIIIGFSLILWGIAYIIEVKGEYRAVIIPPEVIIITFGGIFLLIGLVFLIWAFGKV